MSKIKVTLLAHTPQPEKVVAAAAKLCYANSTVDQLMDGLTPEKSREFVKMLAEMGHESPTEHASFTFAIEGVSRSLLAQITRHRMASFSVQSQRYVRMDDFEAVVPPVVQAIPEAEEVYAKAMDHLADLYEEMVSMLEKDWVEKLEQDGADEKTARLTASKMANEDARFLLPNACATRLIVTMNARSLNHFFRLRCCNRAQWEIREVAEQMLQLAGRVSPALFAAAGPGCAAGNCTEGKMSCGDAAAVREKYAALRKEFEN